MTWNATVPEDVKAEVADGTVTLKGTANWEFQRNEADRSVRGVIGVRGVRNLIQLKARPGVPQAVESKAVERKIVSAFGR